MRPFGVRSTTSTAPRRSLRRLASIVSTFAIICSALVVALVEPGTAQAGALTFDLSLIGGEREVAPNEDLAYRVTISCSGLDTPCGATTVTMALPETLNHRSTVTGAGFTATFDGPSRVVTVSHPDLQDGASAELTIGVRVAADAPPSSVIEVSADAVIERPSPDTAAELSAGPVTVTTTGTTPQWDVEVTRSSPSGAPAPGGTASYSVRLCALTGRANTDLSGATLVLAVPDEVITTTFATDGGVVDEQDGVPTTVTWSLGDITVAGLYGSSSTANKRCITRAVLVRFATDLATGTTVTATATGTGTAEPSGEALELGPATHSDVLTAPVRDLVFDKYGETSEQAGSVIDYTIRVDSSRSNVPLDDLVVVDELPAGLEPLQVQTGYWNRQGVYADVGYSVDGGATWSNFGTTDGEHTITWDVASVVDPTTVTHLRWVFRWTIGDETYPGVRAGFPDTRFRILARVPADTTLTGVTNCATASHDGIVEDDCVGTTIEPQAAAMEVYKSVSGSPFQPGDEVGLTLHVRNVDSGPLVEPVVADLLPAELEFVRWSWISTSSALTPRVDPWLLAVEDHAGTGRTLLRLGWSNEPPTGAVRLDGSPAVPNSTTIAESSDWTRIGVVARVPDGAASGRAVNRTVGFPSDPSTACVVQHAAGAADTLDLDGDGDTTEIGCNRDIGFDVTSTAVIETEKWVSGHPDLTPVVPGSPTSDSTCPDDGEGFTRYPCAARTVPGGDFEYRLEIVNVGNIDLTDQIVYDVLPAPDDTGVTERLSQTRRLSSWRPLMTGPIEAVDATTDAADLIVEYSDAADACRPEMSASADESGWQPGCTDDWTASPDRWGDVRAIRVRARPGGTQSFAPGIRHRFRVPMRAPDDAPFDSVAWNSVGSRATSAETGGRLAAAEPRKVGIVIPTPEEIPFLDLALRATVTDRRPDPLEPGRAKVTIGIEVLNQGTATADGADVSVVVPEGLTYLAADNADWTGADGATDGERLSRPIGALAPGDTTTVELVLDVDSGTGGDTLRVVAEISAVDAGEDDIDSTPDALDGDPLIDDEIDRTPADDPPDEDDHDVADVTVDRLTYRVGDLVWLDGDADGEAGRGEPGIDGVRIELWEDSDENRRWSTDDELVAVTASADGGRYAFDGLLSGDYLLVVPDDQGDAPDPAALDGTRPTSTGAGADAEVDHDHDGLDGAAGDRDALVTTAFSLGPRFSEPTGETVRAGDGTSAEDGALPDDRSNLTVDLGFVRVRLGDVVWLDDGAGNDTDDGERDDGEAPISDLVVELWSDDGDGELTPGGGDTRVGTTVTDAEGRYHFDGFDPDASWFVAVPDGQVATAGDGPVDVAALSSSTGTSTADEHDHGVDGPDGYVAVVGPLVVTPGETPVGETVADGSSAEAYADARGPVVGDASSDLTADIGLSPPPRFRIGNLVWRDDDGDGRAEPGEPGIGGVRVELWADDGDGAPSAEDEIVASTTTDAAGHYLFSGLEEGDYLVVVPDDQYGADDPAALAGLAPTDRSGTQSDNRATGRAATIGGVDGPVDGLVSELVSLDADTPTSRQEAVRLGVRPRRRRDRVARRPLGARRRLRLGGARPR
ncbi:MAG: SdrD B-like domain-containing protein [Actinomycetota bacterium]|nr:SdrD B-like domain-containing protein [Actinomycetota bacterium]